MSNNNLRNSPQIASVLNSQHVFLYTLSAPPPEGGGALCLSAELKTELIVSLICGGYNYDSTAIRLLIKGH